MTTTTTPIDPAAELAAAQASHEAWAKFADTPECARLWVLLAVIEEVGRLAAEWLDELPDDSPARAMSDSDEMLDDVQAIGRACRLFGSNIASVAPLTPPLRVVLVQTHVADLRLSDDPDPAA